MMILVKEVFLWVLTGLLRDGHQVEVIKDLLLLRSPVVIVEVVINPHESLIDQFWNNGFSGGGARYWELHLLASSHPRTIETGI